MSEVAQNIYSSGDWLLKQYAPADLSQAGVTGCLWG